MGYVFAEITLKNTRDVINTKRGISKESEIHQKNVQALVDTGAFTLVINEELSQELGLEILDEKEVTLANKTKVICKLSEPVEIHWKDRSTSVQAAVLPDTNKIFLGALPLEYMDLIVDPVRQELTGAHGDEWVCYI